MTTKRLFLFILSLYIVNTAIAQTYPTDSWREYADSSWYNETDTEFDIATAEELAGLSELVEDGNDFEDKTINLISDIDLDGFLWEPIGYNHLHFFSGTVQGNNHTVSNLWITGLNRDFLGLFGQTVGAKFYDLKLDTANIDDIGSDSGSLVANMFTNGVMENCHAVNIDIKVLGPNIGGLNGGVLTDSYIKNSSFSGRVEGVNQVGGLSGNVWDKSQVLNSFSEGEVHGEYIVGGLIGFGTMAFGANREVTIENSYSRSDVYATDPFGSVGGIYGWAQTSVEIKNVYSTGKVEGLQNVGAFAGQIGGVLIENSYFDVESSELTEPFGTNQGPDQDVEGLTTNEMTNSAFADTLNEGTTDNPWVQDPEINDGYPHLGQTLSIGDFIVNNLEVKIYPSTVDQEFKIHSSTELSSYNIYNILGQLVGTGKLSQGEEHTVSASNLKPGVHIVEIQSATQKISKKIIKK